MRRNCNVNLHTLPSNASSSSTSILGNYQLGSCSGQDQIKIFYSDATELQAIYILWLARREMEGRSQNTNPGSLSLQLRGHGNRGLSLKKSLQKFLQRRKDRIQASMPY